MLRSIRFSDVEFIDGFWAERTKINREKTLAAVYHQTERTFRFEALKGEWSSDEKRYRPHVFWDSDIAKWMEAASYTLHTHPTSELNDQLNEIIQRYEALQAEDGYLNSYYQQVEPDKRWGNIRDLHELYCAGHLIEAAVAHNEATGERQFLDVVCRYVDLIESLFGNADGQMQGYPGHQELELALIRLYEVTDEVRYLELAQYFIDQRGQQPHYYDQEAVARGDKPENFWAKTYAYNQSHLPVREQTTAEGHSVRALYMYAAMADLARITDDEPLKRACLTLWDDVVKHKLYITGALGSTRLNEGFTSPYDLPDETAYAETCASIALVLWARRMFLLDPASKYIDVLERALYNGFLSGLSLDGTRFFYSNPLAGHPAIDPFNAWSPVLNTQGKPYEREEWYDCACCPSNIARLIASIGGYFYALDGSRLYVNLYGQNRASVQIDDVTVQIEQITGYPYKGAVQLSVSMDQPTEIELALRIPEWCESYTVMKHSEPISVAKQQGYVVVTVSRDCVIELNLAMPIARVRANPKARHMAGKVALQRGPIVYCLEEVDDGQELTAISLPSDSELSIQLGNGVLQDVPVIHGNARRDVLLSDGLYHTAPLQYETIDMKAIPFALWANRGAGEMRVWIRET